LRAHLSWRRPPPAIFPLSSHRKNATETPAPPHFLDSACRSEILRETRRLEAAHCDLDHFGKLTDAAMTHDAQAGARFHEIRFPDNGNIFRSRDGILGKPGLARHEEKVRGVVCLMDACRKRNHEDSVRPLVTIAGVKRNDNDRAPSFLRGIDRQLNEPNLSAKGRFVGGRHLARTVQKLGQGEFSPLFFLGIGLHRKAIVKTRNRSLYSLPSPLFVERAKKVIQDTGDRSPSRTLARRAQIPQ